jgi:hypothetical protein
MKTAREPVDLDEAKRILSVFADEQVDYVLIGSMAMAAQGLVRATRDMDFFVSSSPENVKRLRSALKILFDDDPSIDQITAEDLSGDYPAIQYVPPNGRYSLDILSRLGNAIAFEDIESNDIVVDGIPIKVASPRALYSMKRFTARAQDRLDAEMLRERFGLEEGD